MIMMSADFVRLKDPLAASCSTWTGHGSSTTYGSHPATAWRHYVEIGRGSTASALTTNGGSAFAGLTATPTTWKSSTTTEERSHA